MIDIKAKIDEIVNKIKNDKDIAAKFQENPVKTVEEIIGYGDEYFETEITFTDRAKKVLEEAWKLAKTRNELKIESSHLLYAMTNYPDCVAMKVLEQLGADVIEIKQGIILEKQSSEKQN